MKFLRADKNLNWVGEFRDKKMEKRYYIEEIQPSLRYARFVILLAGVVFFSIGFFDYTHDMEARVYFRSIVARGVLLALSVLLAFLLERLKRPLFVSCCTAVFPCIIVICYSYTLVQQHGREFAFQGMGVMLVIFCTTLLPARWVHMVFSNIFIVVSFLAVTPLYSETLAAPAYSKLVIYLVLSVLFSTLIQHRLSMQRRARFLREMELKTKSITDGLTGLYNRMWFDSTLATWCSAETEQAQEFSLVLVDIDDFKAVNDTHGHPMGDKVLIECTRLICTSVRASDTMARWGGEEFVLLLPGLQAKKAAELAERMRIRVADHFFEGVGQVTCSFGVVFHMQDETAESIIKRVDKQLYIAKKRNKNCIASDNAVG